MANGTNRTDCGAMGGDDETEMLSTEVHIVVTPLLVKGMDAVCEIKPRGESDEHYVEHGIIRVPRGERVELHFHLQDGDYPDLVFADQPWSSREGKCPAPADNDSAQFPQAAKTARKTAQVRAMPTVHGARHYSLNFDGGIRCDPVIIRD